MSETEWTPERIAARDQVNEKIRTTPGNKAANTVAIEMQMELDWLRAKIEALKAEP